MRHHPRQSAIGDPARDVYGSPDRRQLDAAKRACSACEYRLEVAAERIARRPRRGESERAMLRIAGRATARARGRAFLSCIDDPDCDLAGAAHSIRLRRRGDRWHCSDPTSGNASKIINAVSPSATWSRTCAADCPTRMFLSDANAELLIAALAAERRRRDDELIAASGSPAVFYNLMPVAYSDGDTRETLLAKTQAVLRLRCARAPPAS